MSKSLGNVMDPFPLVEKYGTDALRYYLARYVSPFEDSDFTVERLQEVYNADLANGLGNLVSRTTNMLEKFASGKFERKASKTLTAYSAALKKYRFDEALKIVWEKIDQANKLIDDKEPWKMVKDRKNEAVKTLLEKLANQVLDINGLLMPFIPGAAEKITTAFTQPVKKAEPLWPRIV